MRTSASNEPLRARLAILAAARATFAAKGYDGTTLAEIAQAAELPLADVALRFPTREHLALGIWETLAEDLAAAAVDLPSGTMSARFEALIRVRLAQCETHRRPLTALLGPALDPASPLHVLGSNADATRAKVQGAFGVVVAGSTDAPRDDAAIADRAQLLYSVHLAIVLAALVREDARWAEALLRRVSTVLAALGWPIAGKLVGRGVHGLLLDRPRRTPSAPDDVARAVLERIFHDNRVLPGVPTGLTPASAALHLPLVRARIDASAPIELVLPAFPAKAPNPRKVLGRRPDLAERRALTRLVDLLDRIGEISKPGARLVLCSDGHVFADAVGVPDEDVDAYRDALLAQIDDPRIRWFELADALGRDLAPDALRTRLLERYGEDVDALRARAKTSKALSTQIDGIHRFLFEDLIARDPALTRTQAKNRTRALAYEVVRRSEAWGALVARAFPSALRLSIHPQPDPSTKIGVNLLGVSDPWLTPWHGVAVVGRTGTTLMHRADAEALGARVVEHDGAPSHMELP